MPMPGECPMEFACMPEHFIEDAMDSLVFTSRIPRALDGFLLDDFLNFIIMFMASPSYVKNPYLRAKMVEVLNCWMPQRSGVSATASLFEGHPLSLDYLVKNLLKVYVDIEFTGSHTQDNFSRKHERSKEIPKAMKQLTRLFPNKFNIRLPQDEAQLLDWKRQLDLDVEALKAQSNNSSIRSFLNQNGLQCSDLEKTRIKD